MSYDLYFYKRKGSNVSKKEIFTYLEESGVKKEDPSHTNYFYQNKKTGVYFVIEDEVSDDENWGKEQVTNNEEFDSLNFALLLNNIRPDFFGKETSLFVDSLVKKFDLYTFDFIGDLIFKPNEGEIYNRWSKPNKSFSFDQNIAGNLFYYPLDKSQKIWEFDFNSDKMQEELGDNYYVPNVFYQKDKEANEVVTITTWTNHIPTVIPEVDYVFLMQMSKGFFGAKKKIAIVRYQTLMDTMGKYFEGYKNNGKIIRPDNSVISEKNFKKILSEKENTFESIGLELITNYKK